MKLRPYQAILVILGVSIASSYWIYSMLFPGCPVPLIPGERPKYGNISSEAFSKLPPYPAHLAACRELPLDQLQLCPQCYLQPEILGPIWEMYGDPMWASYGERIHFVGFGANPGRVSFRYSPGDELIIYTLVRAAFGVRNPQKLSFEVEAPSGFSVEIRPPKIELGSTYPVFQPNWIQFLRIKISSPPEAELPTEIKIYARGEAVGGVIPKSELMVIMLRSI